MKDKEYTTDAIKILRHRYGYKKKSNMGRKIVIAVLIILSILLFVGMLPSCSAVQSLWPKPDLAEKDPATILKDVVYKNNWMISLCVLSIGLGVVAFANGYRWGLSAVIGGGVSIWVQLTLVRYAHIITFAGLALGILTVGYAIYVKRKAIREIIMGMEHIKIISDVSPDDGVNEASRCMSIAQSSTTEKIVSKIKKGLK